MDEFTFLAKATSYLTDTQCMSPEGSRWLGWLVIRIVVRSDFKVPQGTQNPETLKLDPCFVVSERGGQTLIVRFWHESTARAMYT